MSSQPFSIGNSFEAVQAKLSEQASNHTVTRMRSQALLTGRIFDDHGNRMSPSPRAQRKHQVSILSVLCPTHRNSGARGISAPRAGNRH